MKHYQIKEIVKNITNMPVHVENNCVCVLVAGNKTEKIKTLQRNISAMGWQFAIERGHTFNGVKFMISIVNTGTTFNEDWKFVRSWLIPNQDCFF